MSSDTQTYHLAAARLRQHKYAQAGTPPANFWPQLMSWLGGMFGQQQPPQAAPQTQGLQQQPRQPQKMTWQQQANASIGAAPGGAAGRRQKLRTRGARINALRNAGLSPEQLQQVGFKGNYANWAATDDQWKQVQKMVVGNKGKMADLYKKPPKPTNTSFTVGGLTGSAEANALSDAGGRYTTPTTPPVAPTAPKTASWDGLRSTALNNPMNGVKNPY